MGEKILFCNVAMGREPDPCIYESGDRSVPAARTPVRYPVSAYLEAALTPGEQVRAVLLAKEGRSGRPAEQIALCAEELEQAAQRAGARLTHKVIRSFFTQTQETHDGLLLALTDEMTEGAHLLADMTYGPKDLPIVLFTALNFAERFLHCEIGHILYGQAEFRDGRAVGTQLCDMGALYCLNSVVSTVQWTSPAPSAPTAAGRRARMTTGPTCGRPSGPRPS